MRIRWSICGLVIAAAVIAASPAFANVYASGLQQTGPTSFSYILNENADTGVTIELWKVGGGLVNSYNVGPQAKGTQTFTWDTTGSTGGLYTAKVIASDDGYAGWTKITADNTQNNFYSPRGVTVNTIANSPYFGRVYVVEPVGGPTAAGRTTSEGLYLLNADITDAVGQGNTGLKGGITWGTTNSPYRAEVGPDAQVYISDWSDAHSGLWQGNPDMSSAIEVLDSTGRSSVGLNATHGSISATMVEGTGANRKIYTVDEDFPANVPQKGSILRYDIGTAATWTGAPSSVFYDDAANGDRNQNYNSDLIRANDGTVWMTQSRSGGADTLPSLWQISADGTTVLWSSIPSLASTSLTDPLRRTNGMSYDPATNLIALATSNAGQVLLFDPVSKSIVSSFTLGATATNRDLDYDAAGNIYVVDNITERLQVFSPGTGANAFTTETYFTLVPEPSSMLVLLAGLPTLLLRRKR